MSSKKIVMIHFAGGNCYSYQFLKKELHDFQVEILELPGRGKRMNEALIRDIDTAVNDLYQQLLQREITEDYMLYGHSMGATLSVLLAEKLAENNRAMPTQLLVSGSCGPGAGLVKKDYLLGHNEFKAMLKRLGGIPNGVLEEDELFEFFEPAIRSDFELLQKQSIQVKRPLSVPIHAIMGTREEDVTHIENWRNLTDQAFDYELWPGDHFFIHDHPERLAQKIRQFSETLSYKIH